MTRFHELDALRAVAMLLGVVLHSLLFLMPDPLDLWPVQEPWAAAIPAETNPYVHLYLLIHGFRMPVFFLLSGFFTAMLWQRRGLRSLVEHRLKRIGLPLAVSAVTVIPVCFWVFGAFGGKLLSNIDLLSLPVFFHLWFLWHLLWLLAFFVIVTRLGLKFTSLVWWLLIPLAVLPLFFMTEHSVGPDTSATLLPNPNVLAFYAVFFLFGVFFYQRGIAIGRWWAVALVPAMSVAYIGALVFVLSEPRSADWAATAFFQAAYAWLMCFGMMGLFLWIARQERPWVRYISDSSYWLYLWHLPLVVVAQWLLVDLAISVHLKFLLVFASVTALLLVSYQLGVRYTWIGAMLNGRRSRRPQTEA